MYAGQMRSGVPCQYPSDRASQVSWIGGTVKAMTESTENTTGRVAVITGASSGIGEATARALAADGHRVALLARRLDRIHALADELGDGAIAIQADVTDRDSIVAAAQRVQDDLGGADILVNNAGVMLLGPFSAQLSGDYRRMIETNLVGAITTTEVFLDQLRADGRGDLINLSSVAGRTARSGNAVYAATKWGMNGWSESLRQQLQPEVRVIVIEPGAVATELPDHITHGETRTAVEQMYEATAIAPQDIAEIIAFAVSRPRSVSLNEILVRPTTQEL
jgi:NADP-dependent 3-hydroxy acid dehydrogenase YdfG